MIRVLCCSPFFVQIFTELNDRRGKNQEMESPDFYNPDCCNNNGKYQIVCGDQQLVFDPASGPMPRSVSVKRFDGSFLPVIVNRDPGFSIADGEGRVFFPRLTESPLFSRENGAEVVRFNQVEFFTADGEKGKDLTASFQYEIFPDGTVFTDCFFLSNRADRRVFQDLKISFNTDVSGFDDVRYALLHRPAKQDGAVIQDLSPKRFQERNTPLNFSEILPLATFNCFENNGEDLYFEFFMEGGTTLSGRPGENSTLLSWQNNSPSIVWNFQTVPAEREHLVFQFRNRWGWSVKTPPRERHMPPLTMYHYFDNTVRYPSENVLEALRDSSCDVLIIHENWRLDIQNGGIPFNEKELKMVIEKAHSFGIRIALYMRGAELSAMEDFCSWFDRYLRKDYDGLYMDYGGAMTHTEGPSENFVDGRTFFRRQYMKLRSLRERVGKDGLFFSHTGTHYAALGMNFMNGYVSGEGERGMLIRGWKQYRYFSMTSGSCGTLWSAAFPEYSTRRIIPFIASAGQYPHSALGEQFISCSLVHPKEPGINDRAFRPLWKLWKMFVHERDIAVYNDFNSKSVFSSEAQTGHYLMISEDRQRALLIVSNFAAEKRTVHVAVDWNRLPFSPEGRQIYLLAPDENTPGQVHKMEDPELTVSLDGFGCAGFYFTSDQPDFKEFLRPYHQVCMPEGKAWLAEIKEQKKLRENPPRWERVLLTLKIADMPAFGYEDSMTVDLFLNESYIVEFKEDGSFQKLCEIVTEDGHSLTTGEISAPVDLGQLLGPGRHHLGVYATHLGEPFYSFFIATLSNGTDSSYDIVFRNDLEDDRAFLHFDVLIP